MGIVSMGTGVAVDHDHGDSSPSVALLVQLEGGPLVLGQVGSEPRSQGVVEGERSERVVLGSLGVHCRQRTGATLNGSDH